MKKLLCCVLCAALVLCCAGCGLKNLKNVELPPFPQVTEKPSPTPLPTPTPSPVPLVTPSPVPLVTPEAPPVLAVPEPTPEPTAAPREPIGADGQVIVNFRHTEEAFYDPETGRQRIMSLCYDTPFVTIFGRPAASAAINGQLAFLDESFYSGSTGEGDPGVNGIREMAEDNYTYIRQSGETELPMEYSLERAVHTARADSAVVSLVYDSSEYTGGAHGSYAKTGYVFDAQTGEMLTLDKLSGDMERFRKRALYCMVSLTETDGSLFDHIYVNYINGDFYGSLGKLLREGAWYFDENGLVFCSSLYELGPYAAGIAEFHIAYSRLEGYLDEKWLPSAHNGQGEISASLMDGSEEGRVAFLDRVQASEIGSEICLSAVGSVYNVDLSRVSYTGSDFQTGGQLWYASELSNAALQLVTDIPDAVPNLRLRYTDATGAQRSRLISASGEDGHIILIDDRVITG